MTMKNEKLGEHPFYEHLELFPAQKISGTVQTPDGKPAAGVKVEACSLPDTERTDWEHVSWLKTRTDDNDVFTSRSTLPAKTSFGFSPKKSSPPCVTSSATSAAI